LRRRCPSPPLSLSCAWYESFPVDALDAASRWMKTD
jgi:hypothetical protein